MRNKKGSISVEAALVLPFFVFLILTLTNYIKIMLVYDNVQTAVNSAVNTISDFSYLASATGLKDASEQLASTSTSDAFQDWLKVTGIFGGEEVTDLGSAIENFDPSAVSGESLKELFKNGDFHSATGTLVVVMLNNGLKGDSASAIDRVFSLGMEGFAERSIKNYFTAGNSSSDFNTIMKNFGLTEQSNGYFDFEGTSVVLGDGQPEISVVVNYEYKFKFFTEEVSIPITQRVVAYPWVGK